MKDLYQYLNNTIWIKEYPISYAGAKFNARMTIIRLSNGNLLIHSPCLIDKATKRMIEKLGKVEFIVAPGSYHYFYVSSAQNAFPDAETLICPGIETKKPELNFDWFLGDRPDRRLQDDFEQVLVRGNRCIWEVAFYHKISKTLILVDLIENITDQTEDVNTNWILKLWWKVILRMWNNPKPAPEYQLGWFNKKAAASSLKQILNWDFERIIIAHGDLIEKNAKAVALKAWQPPLALSENLV